MEKILCVYCGDLFAPSPRHKNQIACKKPQCQRAKKADWQRHKMKIDPVYRASQKLAENSGPKPIVAIGESIAIRTPTKRNVTGYFRRFETEKPDQRIRV